MSWVISLYDQNTPLDVDELNRYVPLQTLGKDGPTSNPSKFLIFDTKPDAEHHWTKAEHDYPIGRYSADFIEVHTCAGGDRGF